MERLRATARTLTTRSNWGFQEINLSIFNCFETITVREPLLRSRLSIRFISSAMNDYEVARQRGGWFPRQPI